MRGARKSNSSNEDKSDVGDHGVVDNSSQAVERFIISFLRQHSDIFQVRRNTLILLISVLTLS